MLDPTAITPLPLRDPDGVVDDADDRGLQLHRRKCQELLVAEVPEHPRCVVVSRADGTLPQRALELYWAPLTGAEADRVWRERQQEWADRLRAPHVVADTAGHFIQEDQPELVAAVVEAVVTAFRRDEPLNLAGGRIADAGGQLLDGVE